MKKRRQLELFLKKNHGMLLITNMKSILQRFILFVYILSNLKGPGASTKIMDTAVVLFKAVITPSFAIFLIVEIHFSYCVNKV